MPNDDKTFQPGVILHTVIVGVFRSSGTTLGAWCTEHEINPSKARTATYGQAGGPEGQKLLDRIIDAAGREMVERAYAERVKRHAEKVEQSMQDRGQK
ncbi:hypothetical protein [Leisingera sp. MMG026]|uniref:hypothetical protein n=1 Tax=Leisingera sp. MMG026 TaxID=2909982 RepID=UPI001F2CE6F2|nr:hypothetical protein [Leisingera sp. MMG026]MCF6432937.1 hypothetical protein [Leisingera sp. MMG026]